MATMPRQKPHRSRQDYRTPKAFIEAVKDFLGIDHFSHDFAADRRNTQAKMYWDEEINSLSYDALNWSAACQDGWGWLNPPYGNIEPWAQHCVHAKARGANIALLVPASVGSNWFHDYVYDHALVLALRPRISFDGKHPYPKDLILALYSQDLEPGFQPWGWK